MSNLNLPDLTERIRLNQEMESGEINACVDQLTDPRVDDSSKEDFLTAMAKKGETPTEFSLFVSEFRKRAIDPELDEFTPAAIDLCGTGGDKANSFNISTFVSFMLAAAGVPVIKHGNRSISSKCGSADLLEAMGIPISPPANQLKEALKSLNFVFLFAPQFHPSFKHIAPVRKSLAQKGIVTFFNIIGPMINPAKPAYQLVGSYDQNFLRPMAKALEVNGLKSGLVVHCKINDSGIIGVDELTSCGENVVFGFGNIKTDDQEIWPLEKWNQERHSIDELQGGDLARNLDIIRDILERKCSKGLLSTILMNASTAFQICGRVKSLEEGIALGEALLTDGTVSRWIEKASSFFKQ